MWNTEDNILFIDLGTNGEIVFGNKEYLMTCACSAGPAFEGGEISCGMRASGGAIEKVKIGSDYEPIISVIGNEKPLGICGSGIIDLICSMMFAGIIDRKGKIVKNLKTNRIRFDENGIGEYILVFKEQYDLDRDVSITDVDIDNFIRAKAAIYSGITTLLNNLGMDFTMIDKIYIAGGIGNSLNIGNAVKIGMLPDIDQDKINYIGNSSLMGCYLTLMSEDARHKLEEIANHMTYVELSVDPLYMDQFVSACFLPHTDIEKFPTVKKLLEKSL
ncbi:ASKHA domain-containing protein [Clostridium ljungdahlii]